MAPDPPVLGSRREVKPHFSIRGSEPHALASGRAGDAIQRRPEASVYGSRCLAVSTNREIWSRITTRDVTLVN